MIYKPTSLAASRACTQRFLSQSSAHSVRLKKEDRHFNTNTHTTGSLQCAFQQTSDIIPYNR